MEIVSKRKNWTRGELILAFNLYCRTPFGRIHIGNPEIIALADTIGRTPSAVSWKLANFARLDPTLSQRSISGARHGSKEDIKIWREFQNNWEQLTFESQAIVNKPEAVNAEVEASDFPAGESKETPVRVRLNQTFFRGAVLAAYGSSCCITGINLPELLCASHIVPWSVDAKNRTNPQNGLCLNALHDRAFDRGLITITDDYRVKISRRIGDVPQTEMRKMLIDFGGVDIRLPAHFRPSTEFLHYHQQHVFQP
jgi:putative restriction endonuclease